MTDKLNVFKTGPGIFIANNNFNTTEYLRRNGHDITTGMVLTIHDLMFIMDSSGKEIKINADTKTEEILNLDDIIYRIKDLYFLAKTNGISTEKHGPIDYINNLDRTLLGLESDYNIKFGIEL